MKRRFRIAGIAIGIAATVASVYFVASAWRGQDSAVYASPAAAMGISLGIAFYMAGVMISAIGWQRLLAGAGVHGRWIELAGILSVTQVGKYLPGNVAQHIGRASLSVARGIGIGPFVVTMSIELALLTIASILVGTCAMLLSGVDLFGMTADVDVLAIVAIPLMALGLVIGMAIVRRFGPSLMARIAPRQAHWFAPENLPRLPSMAGALVFYCLVYLAFGAGIVAMAGILTPHVPQHGWLLVASFALAWIIGFATPGAPAGVGVREGVMLLVLTQAYPASEAGIIVFALRLATTLGDFLLLPIGWLLLRAAGPRDPLRAGDTVP